MKDQFGNNITFGTVLFVHPARKDGKYPVTYAFMSTGKRIKKLLTAEKLEGEKKRENIEVVSNLFS